MSKREFMPLETGKVVVMGNGDFAVGGCYSPELEMHGIVYMPLPEPRQPGADTTDLFPVGSRASEPAAVIYFKTPAALRQTLGYLTEVLAEMEGKTAGVAMRAIDDVIAERHRQQAVEGWTPAHDDLHDMGSIAAAAGCYAMFTLAYPRGEPPSYWPWDVESWKPGNRRRNLVKAGALILAEIERLDRASYRGNQQSIELQNTHIQNS